MRLGQIVELSGSGAFKSLNRLVSKFVSVSLKTPPKIFPIYLADTISNGIRHFLLSSFC